MFIVNNGQLLLDMKFKKNANEKKAFIYPFISPNVMGLHFSYVDFTLYSCATHINGMYACVLGFPKGKFSKQRTKKLVTEL